MIGIIGAMEVEVEALKEAMTIEEVEEKADPWPPAGERWQGRDVVAGRSGVGKRRTPGSALQILIDDFGGGGHVDQHRHRRDLWTPGSTSGIFAISTEALDRHDMDAKGSSGIRWDRCPGWMCWHSLADPELAREGPAGQRGGRTRKTSTRSFLGRVVGGAPVYLLP